MNHWKRYALATLFILLIASFGSVFTWVPAVVDRFRNQVTEAKNQSSPLPTFALVETKIPIADLHADTLIWNRNPAEKQTRGHVDLPRLKAGGVSLQVFSVVTRVPLSLSIHKNSEDSFDLMTLLSIAQLWPYRTWFHPYERALYEADRFRQMVADPGNDFTWVRAKGDLNAPTSLKGILSMEGLHELHGDLNRIVRLYEAGFRMMAPTHFLDTEIAGSAHGENKGGLTPFGRQWLSKVESLNITVDLAHASAATFDEVLQRGKNPPIVSHTGLKGTCNNARNLTDDQAKAIASKGGLIGIGYWSVAVCGGTLQAVAQAIAYGVYLVGAEHIALGSDFDGFVSAPISADRLQELAGALRQQKLSEKQIKQVLSENVFRFFSQNLPSNF